VRGEGVYIWDADGGRYLDFSGQAAANFIGHGVAAISEAVAAQASQLEFVHSSQFTTAIAEEYGAELLEFAGKHFRGGSVYFTSGGSEAVETALKLARQYQIEIGQSRRYHMLSRTQSYHGSTLGALAASGNVRRRQMYIPMTRAFTHVGIPYSYRCVDHCLSGCTYCAEKCAGELEKAIDLSDGEAGACLFTPCKGR
jgi:adenosylmethionine-8-amino-7-oxononanoate aminotransferase